MAASSAFFICLCLALFGSSSDVAVSNAATVRTLAVGNHCRDTVWLGVFPANTNRLSNGFQLEANQSLALKIPNSWSGTVQGRWLSPEHGAGNSSCANGGVAELTEGKLNRELDFGNFIHNLTMTAGLIGGSGGENCTTSTICTEDFIRYCSNDIEVNSLGGSIGTCSSSYCLLTFCPKHRKHSPVKVPGTPSPGSHVPGQKKKKEKMDSRKVGKLNTLPNS